MRLIVTFLSIGTIFAYGYALAGLGGFLIGRGSVSYIVWGILCGTAFGGSALWLWHRNLDAFYVSEKEEIDELKKMKISLPPRDYRSPQK